MITYIYRFIRHIILYTSEDIHSTTSNIPLTGDHDPFSCGFEKSGAIVDLLALLALLTSCAVFVDSCIPPHFVGPAGIKTQDKTDNTEKNE